MAIHRSLRLDLLLRVGRDLRQSRNASNTLQILSTTPINSFSWETPIKSRTPIRATSMAPRRTARNLLHSVAISADTGRSGAAKFRNREKRNGASESSSLVSSIELSLTTRPISQCERRRRKCEYPPETTRTDRRRTRKATLATLDAQRV